MLSATGTREREAPQRRALSEEGARRARVIVKQFRDGFFPSQVAEIKETFEELKSGPRPDVVLTHFRHDRHQDHRVLSDLTWNTFRDHCVLEYEIPKYDGDMGSPNCFIPLDQRTSARKVKYLQTVFGSQRDKHWFNPHTFFGLMRLRGMECRAPHGLAEGFYARKLVLQP